jgi:DNA-binding LacI/PurR family transcriptional regulator
MRLEVPSLEDNDAGGQVPKRVTATDVAVAVGVSRSTVSFVLNDTPGQTISPGVRERVIREADRLGYLPDPHARALASGQSKIVLVLLPEWPVEFLFREMLEQASLVLDEAGYTLVTTDPRRREHTQRLWRSLRPDIVLSIGPASDLQSNELTRAGIRLLAPDSAAIRSLTVGPAMQVEHLQSLGHRKIAFAGSGLIEFRDMNAARLTQVRNHVQRNSMELLSSNVEPSSIRDVLDGWLEAGVTAVAGFNDNAAALVVGAALRRGVRIPDDLAIVGHDDSPLAALITPALTTVRFDLTELGRVFARRAIAGLQHEQIEEFREESIKVQLVQRESTGKHRPRGDPQFEAVSRARQAALGETKSHTGSTAGE